MLISISAMKGECTYNLQQLSTRKDNTMNILLCPSQAGKTHDIRN